MPCQEISNHCLNPSINKELTASYRSTFWLLKSFPSIKLKSVSSFYELVLTHDKGQGWVLDLHDHPYCICTFSQGAQWTANGVWADSHLRAIDSSHWNHMDDIRVSFHRSALQVLEDSDHLLHPSFYFQSFFVSYMTLSKLPCLSSFFPLAVAFIRWLWPLFVCCDLYSSWLLFLDLTTDARSYGKIIIDTGTLYWILLCTRYFIHLLIYSLHQPYDMKIIISPVLQMRKLKHRLKNFQRTHN